MPHVSVWDGELGVALNVVAAHAVPVHRSKAPDRTHRNLTRPNEEPSAHDAPRRRCWPRWSLGPRQVQGAH